MKRNIIFLLTILVVLITGCLNSNNSTNDLKIDSTIASDNLKKSIPAREEIREDILTSIDINVKSSPRRVSEIGNYYFSLSKEKVIVSGTDGTVEIDFIFIEDYQGGSEEIYTGSIS